MKSNRLFLFPLVLASLIWIFFSYWFRLDRIYGDAAAYLLDILNKYQFIIFHNRPSSIIIEWVPVILAKMHQSVDYIIIGMSIGEALMIGVFVFVAYFFFKDIRLALTILLTLFMGDRYNYFNPVSELYLAMPVFFLIVGAIVKYGTNRKTIFLLIPLIIFVVFSHTLYNFIFPSTLILLFFVEKINRKELLLWFGIVSIVILAQFLSLDNYDQKQLIGSDDESIGQFLIRYFTDVSMFKNSGYYLSNLFVFIVALIWFKINGNKKVVIAATGIYFFYFVIVVIKYSILFPDTMEPYERYVFPLAIISGLVFYLSGEFKKPIWPLLTTAVILIQGIFMFNYGKGVQKRYHQLRNVIEYAQIHNRSKVVVNYFNFNPYRLGSDWIMTSESLLLSRIVGNHATVQVGIKQAFDKRLLRSLDSSQYVQYPWYCLDYSHLNHDYFYLEKQPLTFLNTLEKNPLPLEKVAKGLFVELPITRLSRGRKPTCEIYIRGTSNDTIRSGNKNGFYYLYYDWIPDTGESALIGGKCRLLCDVYPLSSYKQLCEVKIPKNKGNYRFQMYLGLGEEKVLIPSACRDYSLN
jgi:hypothetical protein